MVKLKHNSPHTLTLWLWLQQDEDGVCMLPDAQPGAAVARHRGRQHPHAGHRLLHTHGPDHLPGCRHAEVSGAGSYLTFDQTLDDWWFLRLGHMTKHLMIGGSLDLVI